MLAQVIFNKKRPTLMSEIALGNKNNMNKNEEGMPEGLSPAGVGIYGLLLGAAMGGLSVAQWNAHALHVKNIEMREREIMIYVRNMLSCVKSVKKLLQT